MSTLALDTLNNRAGTKTVPVDTVIDGSAKAWVNFNGTGTVAIRASFNVSSITDNGTGDYTVNFTNALADASYCPSFAIGHSNGGRAARQAELDASTTNATSCRVYVNEQFSTFQYADAARVCVSFFR